MPDFVATVHVLAGQAVWPADEVPHLTAGALYRVTPKPDPVVQQRELRRFTLADLRNPDASPEALGARELSGLAERCAAAGLPAIPHELPYSQWGAYLEAFNLDAEARGWWAGLTPAADPQSNKRLALAITAEEHRKFLKNAIARGQIQAKMAGTLVPATPGAVNLQSLVLTREQLVKFASQLAMQVADIPHFVTAARPTEMPQALLELPDDAQVSWDDNLAGTRGSGITTAATYRETIRATIARQAEGHFTLNEAAQVLADSRPGLDPVEPVKRFRLAHSKGELPIHQGGSRFPLEVGETVRDFWDTVEVGELDAWLRASVGYGFPSGASGIVTESPPAPAPDALQPLQRFPAQESEILSVIRKLGYDPQRLPFRAAGKPWVKTEAWKAIGVGGLFVSERVFEKAWERLRASGEIKERPGL